MLSGEEFAKIKNKAYSFGLWDLLDSNRKDSSFDI